MNIDSILLSSIHAVRFLFSVRRCGASTPVPKRGALALAVHELLRCPASDSNAFSHYLKAEASARETLEAQEARLVKGYHQALEQAASGGQQAAVGVLQGLLEEPILQITDSKCCKAWYLQRQIPIRSIGIDGMSLADGLWNP